MSVSCDSSLIFLFQPFKNIKMLSLLAVVPGPCSGALVLCSLLGFVGPSEDLLVAGPFPRKSAQTCVILAASSGIPWGPLLARPSPPSAHLPCVSQLSPSFSLPNHQVLWLSLGLSGPCSPTHTNSDPRAPVLPQGPGTEGGLA